jgi:hypothetical protein
MASMCEGILSLTNSLRSFHGRFNSNNNKNHSIPTPVLTQYSSFTVIYILPGQYSPKGGLHILSFIFFTNSPCALNTFTYSPKRGLHTLYFMFSLHSPKRGLHTVYFIFFYSTTRGLHSLYFMFSLHSPKRELHTVYFIFFYSTTRGLHTLYFIPQ